MDSAQLLVARESWGAVGGEDIQVLRPGGGVALPEVEDELAGAAVHPLAEIECHNGGGLVVGNSVFHDQGPAWCGGFDFTGLDPAAIGGGWGHSGGVSLAAIHGTGCGEAGSD